MNVPCSGMESLFTKSHSCTRCMEQEPYLAGVSLPVHVYRTASTSTLAEVAKDHGNVIRAGSFINGLDIYEYHCSLKGYVRFDSGCDYLSERRRLHGAEDHRGSSGLGGVGTIQDT